MLEDDMSQEAYDEDREEAAIVAMEAAREESTPRRSWIWNQTRTHIAWAFDQSGYPAEEVPALGKVEIAATRVEMDVNAMFAPLFTDLAYDYGQIRTLLDRIVNNAEPEGGRDFVSIDRQLLLEFDGAVNEMYRRWRDKGYVS